MINLELYAWNFLFTRNGDGSLDIAWGSRDCESSSTPGGADFVCWEETVKRLHCEVCFTAGTLPWQKGTNENTNGLLREFYPKGRSLTKLRQSVMNSKVALWNWARNGLNYYSPLDEWHTE